MWNSSETPNTPLDPTACAPVIIAGCSGPRLSAGVRRESPMKWMAGTRAAWWSGRGFGAFGKGNYEAAIRALERARHLSTEPDDFVVLTTLGRAYAAVGRYSDAAETLESARQDCARHRANTHAPKYFRDATSALVGVLRSQG